jgi:sugar lactone lactonase YvrE
MAIECAAFLRRLVRIVTLVLVVAFLGYVSAVAQVPVMAGSVVPNTITASQNIGQIYRILIANNGDVLFLDNQNGALYEMQPGSTSLITLSGPGQVLRGNQAFWASSMALDQWNNLYIGGLYAPQPDFYRVPYDPTTNTWPLTGSNSWTQGNTLVGELGVNQIAIGDGGGATQNMVISTETSPQIWEFTIDINGNVGTETTLIKDLTAEAAKLAVDHAGNVYFIEDCWEARTSVAVGLWMIPAGTSGTQGEVSPVVRLDPPALAYNFKGVTVDAAGDLLLSSEIDTGGTAGADGNFDGVLMVPNESGSPTTATQATLNWNHAVMLAPVTATADVAIDPRGYLWIPTPVAGWAPVNTTEKSAPVYPGSLNFVTYSLGSVNLGASPTGTPGATGSVYFTFGTSGNTASTTPAKIVFSEPGSGSDFIAVSTNPVMNPAVGTTPPTVDTTVVPCTAGTAYAPGTSCPYWLAVNPSVVGPVSGQLQMLDSSGKVISSAFVYGVGQGPEVSLLGSPALLPIGSAFTKPEQVAVDPVGNVYVADAGQGKVLQYSVGSTTPVPIGTGLTAPTGVAVDGNGDVYIGDSGRIIEVPYQSGALNSLGQTTLLENTTATPLGHHLNLAVDGAGNVYVADSDNAQVVKISNFSLQSSLFNGSEIVVNADLLSGGGFTAPSAVAVDGAGDLFVADGTNLDEVTPWGGQSTITTQLSGSVTGLAVDASGSVYVTESAGLERIPAVGGTLTVNNAVGIEIGTVVTPAGVALDRTGNLYVSYLASGTPSVAELSTSGNYAFGVVTPVITTTADVQLYDIGNMPLTLNAFAGDLFTGANASDFSVQTAGENPPCDPSTPISAAMYCYFGFGVAPSLLSGTENASLAILSNAANAPSVNLALSANPVVDNRPSTVTTISPISGITYPGNVTITVTVTAQSQADGTPQGTVKLSLTNNGTVTGLLNSSGVATFTFSNLLGGSYNVNAAYEGYGTLGTAPDFAVSAATVYTFIVAAATPSLSITTNYQYSPATYVLFGGSNTITATVSSAVGVPTGTVAFMNGSNLADPSQLPITLNGLGVATFNTSNLPLGTYTLTAVYSGDQNYMPETIPIATFQIIRPSVLITANPATLALTPGVAGSVTLTLQGLVGFGGPLDAIALFCTTATLPQWSECTFSNTTVAIDPAGSSATVVLTISTNVPVNGGATSASVRSAPAPWALAGIFGFGLVGLAFGRKTRFNGRALTIICLMLLFAGAFLSVTACTNSGYTHTPPAPVVTTPAGASNVAITTTLNGTIVSLPFTLPVTVQ